RPGRAAGGGEHSRALPPRGHRLVDVLWLVERVPGGRQEATRRRHSSRRDFRRGEGSPPRGASVEGGRRRSHPREPPAQKKYDRGWGRRGMRYSASDKTEIIRLVEQSHLPARRKQEKLGAPKSSFYPRDV